MSEGEVANTGGPNGDLGTYDNASEDGAPSVSPSVHKKTTRKVRLVVKDAMEKPPKRKASPECETNSEMECSDGYVKPRKTTKTAALGKMLTPARPVETSNKFEGLPTAETEPRSERPNRNKFNVNPPIVLQGVPNNHREFLIEVNASVKKGFHLKYGPRTTILYVHDPVEYEDYKKELARQEDVQFHTYTRKADKTHAFVVRGLHRDSTVEEIKQELAAEHQLEVVNVYKMNSKAPLFMIVTSNQIVLSYLQDKVRFLSHTRVTWERKVNSRVVTQCRRCQAFGHATSNCFKAPRCVKCAAGHWSRECPKSRDEPAKCANCAGAHPASSRECEQYQRRLEALTKEAAPKEAAQRYVPAPQPRVNAWTGAATREAAHAVSDREFPALPKPRGERQDQPTRPAAAAGGSSSQRNGGGLDDMNAVFSELERLNSMIDLGEALRALRCLNGMMTSASTPMQRLQVLQRFSQEELPKYRI